jgi:hypothetical protein
MFKALDWIDCCASSRFDLQQADPQIIAPGRESRLKEVRP